jgi:putative membrane protein
MLRVIELLIGTVTYRPYVFVFFACYLFLAITRLGYKRTFLFTTLAYFVAWLCEWSSAVAATGFPFGLYFYIDATRDRELWIAGVPLMDSLSFTFLSFVSWELALFCLNSERSRGSLKASLLASFFMMYLDIIIDPLTLLGDRWFLWKIYYYPQGGPYFGVTIANFLGWFFVCFAILRLYLAAEKLFFRETARLPVILSDQYQAFGTIGLYFGILGFNLFMTFWIGEILMGLVGVFIVLSLFVLVLLASRGRRRQE